MDLNDVEAILNDIGVPQVPDRPARPVTIVEDLHAIAMAVVSVGRHVIGGEVVPPSVLDKLSDAVERAALGVQGRVRYRARHVPTGDTIWTGDDRAKAEDIAAGLTVHGPGPWVVEQQYDLATRWESV